MDIWVGKRINRLTVKFKLGNEHASHIDRWVATSVGMKADEIELNFFYSSQEKYVFPSHLIHSGDAPYLKRLCLKSCTLSCPFACLECAIWISNLTTLHLRDVPLHKRGVDLILSAGSNIKSLKLCFCDLPTSMSIAGQLPLLKKLTIRDILSEIKLDCPALEVFNQQGICNSFTFVRVPKLRKVRLKSALGQVQFTEVARDVPFLQVISLNIMSTVKPLRSMVFSRSLRKLKTLCPVGIDLLSITCLINLCPMLEILRLKLESGVDKPKIGNGEYRDRRNIRLKEVEIERFHIEWNVMEFALYLLKNAAALERMVFKFGMGEDKYGMNAELRELREKRMMETAMPHIQELQLLEKANPKAQVSILWGVNPK